MSSIVKTKLKAAKDAVAKKEYEKARDASLAVLDYDSDNYHANVFLGVSYLNLSELGKSEQAYKKATALVPDQPLAWQGLSQLYEKTHDWNKFVEVLEHLAHIFSKANDATKCAETLQKLIDFRRRPEHSTRMQLAQVLSLMLPDSPYYDVLSTLPPPDPTNPTLASTHPTQSAIHNSLPVLEELVSIYEQEENDNIEKEFQKRRTRLGAAGPEQLRKEVALEYLGPSQLPRLYNEIINHPNTSDELRRTTESKLLDHRQRYLSALPSTGDMADEKATVAAEVEELINGIILLKIPNELAWTLFIEAKDAESIEQYDFAILRQFMQLFPQAARASLIKGYFVYHDIPLMDDDEDGEKTIIRQDEDSAEDCIDMIIEAFASLPDSVIAHRVTMEIYQNENDLENTIKIAESGLEVTRRAEQNTGKALPRTKKAFNIALATALVDFFPPKHHPRALGVLTPILAKDPDNVPCLMGRGYILEYAGKWEEAGKVFSEVVRLLPDDLDCGLRAKEENAWCQANKGTLEEAAAALKEVVSVLDPLEERETDKARTWYRLGKCYWDMGADHQEEAYQHFITSLKRASTFAPAFTSLGIYYLDHLSSPDPNRASKCFQKAFELDPRETEAARRLADGFAEEREWELVEVVARRTIDGEGGLEGGTATARYLPINAWAWKAVGVVELIRHNYSSAIQAFQIALRTDVDDQLSWLRLGEAYSKAGRFAAAVKALDHARELNPEDWICSYFIGEVQRQTGAYEEAICAFESILVKRPSELGVLVSLGQTYIDLGRTEAATAYTARAETSFLAAICVTLRLIAASPGYRRVAWKQAADATFHLSRFRQFSDEDAVRITLNDMLPLVSNHPGTALGGIMNLPISLDDTSDTAVLALQVALAAYDYRTSLDALDETASGSAHYDLALALFAYAGKSFQVAVADSARQLGIRQVKEALRCEPSNEQYWDALGSATFASQPKVAQHAYIRALEINSKNAATWTSLGLFYLHHDDAELANEAFYKAQTLDPDYALAWIGQGLVATLNGHAQEARALFEHATGLAAPVPEADVEFAARLFKKVNSTSSRTAPTLDALFPAFFVLDRFCRSRPDDASALHLFGLICERIGHVDLAIEVLGHAMSLLEAAYEETEDPVIEKRFAIAHTNMARLRLSMQDYDSVLASTEVVIGLLPEEPEDAATQILLAQAQFLSGLAKFKLGELPEALAFFEAAMSIAADDSTIRGHIVVLLGQTLWAIGSDEGRESAKTQLLQSIESDPENLTAINTLAGMGILTGDEGLVDAALSEILALPLDQRLSRDPGRDVTYLLIQHNLAQGDVAQALSIAQKSVVVEPSRPEMRQTLAGLNVQEGDSKGALAVLAGASGSQEGNLDIARKSLHLEAITRCIAGLGADTALEARKLAQKSVVLAPWEKQNWQALAFIHNQSQRE